MWSRIEHFADKYHMISEGDRVLLALSGGADSILLARYLLHLRDEGRIELHALHMNHGLRGMEADRDEDYVRTFCESRKIPCCLQRQDVSAYARDNHCSLEEAGRILRYRAFDHYAREHGCHKIALAHHQTDLAETMIFRMLRGTGPEGLSGILPVYGNRIRPLLCLDKEEILQMLSILKQDYVEDSSNIDRDYSRNYIRHELLPRMQEVNRQTLSHLAQLSEQIREQNHYVRQQMDALYHKIVVLCPYGEKAALSDLSGLTSFERKEMIRRMIFHAGGHRRDISCQHVEAVLNLMKKSSGKRRNLPYQLIAEIDGEELYIGPLRRTEEEAGEAEEYEISLEALDKSDSIRIESRDGSIYSFDRIEGYDGVSGSSRVEELLHEFPKNDCVKYFDYDMIKCNLSLRTRRQGDYLVIDSCGRTKRLKRYFIDEKIPASQRDHILLLAEQDHILWVSGGRISEAYKVRKTTQKLLRVSCLPLQAIERSKNDGRTYQCIDSEREGGEQDPGDGRADQS